MSCACRTPVRRAPFAEGATIGRLRIREAVRPRAPRNVEPVVLAGAKSGTRCRPFIIVQKDPDKFAACNALADEIGPLNDPKKAFRLIEDAIGDEVNEVFGVLMLDLHQRMKGMAETGRGEPTSVMAPIGPTVQAVLGTGAEGGAIIFHVHPSGIEAYPSDADIETTEAFADAFAASEVRLLDHIIIGGDARRRSYYSFREDGGI